MLALERHATSKIARVEDLFARSRRSASAARRSRASRRSRGSRLSTRAARARRRGRGRASKGAASRAVAPAAARRGRRVEVRELFFNVPARRKFLKSTGTESAHVGEAVLLAALARPDVTLRPRARRARGARVPARCDARASARRRRSCDEALEACVGARGPLHIEAHLAAPERARAGAVGLSPLRQRPPGEGSALARAVAQAYGSVLEPGRYPVGVVYLDLPPEHVDVNVHPQKAEVRFADARGVFDAVTRELHARARRRRSRCRRSGRRPTRGRSRRGTRTRTPARHRSVGSRPRTARLSPARRASRRPSGAARGRPLAPVAARADPGRAARPLRRARLLRAPPLPRPGARPRSSSAKGTTGSTCSTSTRPPSASRSTACAARSPRGRSRRSGCSCPRSSSCCRPRSRRSRRTRDAVRGARPRAARGRGERGRRARRPGAPRARRARRGSCATSSPSSSRAAGAPSATRRISSSRRWRATARPAPGDALSREEAEALLRALDDVDFAGHCPHGGRS